MKVRKYLLICIAAISLNALTACGGGSTQSDPLDPENPENPEPPAYFNPIEGEWMPYDNNFKYIFTEDYKWQESWFENGKWDEPETKISYKIIDKESFKAGNVIYYFKIEVENGNDILTITYPKGDKSYYRLKY